MENDRKFLISWNLVDSSQKEKYIPMPCNYLLPMGQKGYSVTFERVGMRKIVSSKQVFLKSWLMLVYPRGWFNTSSCSMRWPQPSMCPVNVYTTRNFMHKMQIFTILKSHFHHENVRQIQIQLHKRFCSPIFFVDPLCYVHSVWWLLPPCKSQVVWKCQ